MKHYLAALLIAFFNTSGLYTNAFAENTLEPAKPHITLLDKAAMDTLKQRIEAPQQNHILAPLIGEWHYDLHYWESNDATPQLSNGVITNEMIFDNRYMLSKSSVILNIGGENISHTSWSILGYDPAKEMFTSSLVDTIHKGMITGAGHYNAERKTLEEEGSFIHPLTDKEMVYRAELEFTSDDTHKRTVFIADNKGQEFKKIFELNFRRQK